MDNETEVIRQQMEGTRTALSEKLEKLETQLGEKVQEAGASVAETAATVAETVDNVKETVEETVEAVKDTFDLQHHAERHPWALVGGAVFLGFVGARLLRGPSRPRYREYYPPPPPPRAEPRPAPQDNTGLIGQLRQESTDLKKLGIGVAMSVLREVVAKAVPAVLGPPVAEIVNSLTTKIGGKPLYHSSSEPGVSEVSAHEHSGHEQGLCEVGHRSEALGQRPNPFI
jgi:ElaB/YqjD/DUF883 family membrane-anchored ribosome-binding protein